MTEVTCTDNTTLSRQELIERYLPLVRFIAREVSVPASQAVVSHDDMVSAGMLGLIEAADRFVPFEGTAFPTFAVPRIRGAILDMLRALDSVPRSLRSKARQMEMVRSFLRSELSREPTARELRTALGWPVSVFDDVRNATGRREVSIERGSANGTRSSTRVDAVSDEAEGPQARAERGERVQELRRALDGLSERDRRVILLTFFEERRTVEIARALDISATRIVQIRRRSLDRLRRDLEDLDAA
ncbi:MAG: sigma-70 family RNA polymerase sigma factor [Dehalococcoidia bacterium]